MPSSRYYRFKTTSKEERRKSLQNVIFWFFFTAGFLTVAWAFLMSPFFRITEIQLPESDIVTKEDIGLLGSNILLLSSSRFKENLAAVFPAITNLKIKKELFHTIAVSFEKRTQVGFWCNESGCYSFDKDGIIFKEAPISEGSLILKIKDFEKKSVLMGDKILDYNNLKFILSFAEAMEKDSRLKIIEFKIKPASNIDLEASFDGGWSVYLDPAQNPEAEATNLFTVVGESLKNNLDNLAYIDLRIPSRIFYKFK